MWEIVAAVFLFSVVYSFFAFKSPVKMYSLIHANKNLYNINTVKYTAEITKLQ